MRIFFVFGLALPGINRPKSLASRCRTVYNYKVQHGAWENRKMYYLIVTNKDLFRDFIAKEANFCALISFEGKDTQTVFDLLRRQFFQEHPQYPTNDGIITQYNVSITDDDGNLYYADLKSATFVLQGNIKPSVYFEQLDKLDASHAAAEQKRRKIKEKYRKNTLLRHRSLIPEYKKFSYFDAQYGIEIPFRLKTGKETHKKPLLVFLHGAGALGEENVKQFAEFKTAVGRIKRDCIVLLPQQSSAFAEENAENLKIYAKSLKNMIELLALSYPIDTSRIYLTGISLGGACVWYSLYNCPGFYAAGIPLMGYMPEAYSGVFRKENFAREKIWAGHAKDDKLVPADSDINIYNRIKDVCSIKLSLYDQGGHRMMRAFYRKEQWQEWLFSQSKTTKID